MTNFNNIDDLDLAEYFANNHDLISSEQELSDLFDTEVAPYVISEYSTDDEVAMNEEFNNWTDNLCTEGLLHKTQLNKYCYIGKYSTD